jgi:hypothetical protein
VLTASITALMMKAVSISETSVNLHQTTGRNIPEDNHLYTRRRQNLKPHNENTCLTIHPPNNFGSKTILNVLFPLVWEAVGLMNQPILITDGDGFIIKVDKIKNDISYITLTAS